MKDIRLCLVETEKRIRNLKLSYNKVLDTKGSLEGLNIEVKNILENLKSPLDYLAVYLHDKYVNCGKSHNIYFPLLKKSEEFENVFKGNLHNIENHLCGIKAKIESIQPYKSDWMLNFHSLVNEYKHIRLIPQIEKTLRVVVKNNANNGEASWDPNYVKFRSVVYVMGAPINPGTQMPVSSPNIKVEVWKDFIFEEKNMSVLKSLQLFYREIAKFINEIMLLENTVKH